MHVFAVDLYQELSQSHGFHESRAKWRLLVGGNRSGKTLAAAVEVARAVLGRDPYGKYRPRNGLCAIVGLDYTHISMLWRKLSIPGAFKIVKDGEAGGWRSIRLLPTGSICAMDLERIAEWEDAPPLIPPDAIKGIGWRSKVDMIPSHVVLHNGWRILFVSSKGSVKQGEHYDIVWIDEQIANPDVFYEASRAIVDIDQQWRAYGIWSATGQKQNPILWEQCQRALVSDQVRVWQLLPSGNPYVSQDDLQRYLDDLPEHERAVRIDGMFALEAWRIYPEFDPVGCHMCEPFPIPDNWTRVLAIDPGTSVCATVFGAVDDSNKNLYVYDEMIIRNGSAKTWAQAIAERADGGKFEWWIMDRRAGRARNIGSDIAVAAHYMECAQETGIRPRVMGSLYGFVPGNDNPSSRQQIVKMCLSETDIDNSPRTGIKIFAGRCRELVRQLKIAQFDKNNREKRIKGEFDVLDAFEYLVAFQPKHVERPYVGESSTPSVYEAFLRRKRKYRYGRDYGTIAFG